jgi:small-conductance mechanosensitive channel
MMVVSRILEFVPDWVAGIGIFVLATTAALLVYSLIAKAFLTMVRDKETYLRSLFTRVRRIFCTALILIAVSFSAQLPYFPERVSDLTSKLIGVAVILLAGWSAIIAIDLASNFYTRRYKTDVADNMLARKHLTQIRILRRAVDVLVVIISVAAALMAFEPVRQFGISLFASAGAAGLIVGLAARPVLSNLIAGIQLAITQPIRIDDAVLVEGEWGWIEEITSTYVVIKIWDWRRLIVPLSFFMEKPFQNWTRENAKIIGSVMLQVDYTVPVGSLRARAEQIVRSSPLWDKDVVNVQVTDFKDRTVEVRILASAATSPRAWDLRCEIREKLLVYLQTEFPRSLPTLRIRVDNDSDQNEAAYGTALEPRNQPLVPSGAGQ